MSQKQLTSGFSTPLILKKLRGRSNKYILHNDLVFVSNDTMYTIPTGFVTDLSTFWLEGRHTEASVLHDYLLKTFDNRKHADKMMLLAMESVGVRWWHKHIIYNAIRLYGRIFK